MSTNNAPTESGPGTPPDPQHPDQATPDSAASGGDSPAPAPSYEENPLDDSALREAAASIPVKDYSDYEIEIETKSEYADALFGSDEDLDEALEQSASDKATAAEAPEPETPEPAAPEPTAPQASAAPEYDFSGFLAPSSLTTDDSINRSASAPTLEVAPLNEEQMVLVDGVNIEGEGEAPAAEPEPAAEAEQKPTSFAEKLKQKAKQQFDKSRAQIDEYIGRSLPERNLPLDFTFPIQKSKKDLDGVASGYSIKKLFEDKGKSPLSVFRQADQDLAKINRCQMLGSSRHSLLDTYTDSLIPRALETITSFERKPNLAGDSKRLAIAEHCDAAIKHLILGYKQVYCGYYEAANVVYGPQRNAANAVLARLVELLLIEARLCVALHYSFPTSSIKAINKLFTAAQLYEPQLVASPYTSMVDGGITSVKAMYFEFQVLLVLNQGNLSPLLYRVARPYLKEKLGLLQLCPPGSLTQPGRQYWVISHEHSNAPKLVTGSSDMAAGFSPTVIETTHFLNAIKKDFSTCLAQYRAGSWQPDNQFLAAIKPHYALTIIAALNSQLVQHEQSRIAARYSIYQPVKIRSYSGLEAIIAHLNFSYALATKKPARKGEVVKDLPERPKADKATWRRAKDEPDTAYMQIDEAETTAQLDIGQLLLMLETPGEVEEGGSDEKKSDDSKADHGPHTTLLGLVSGMERIQGNKLNLAIEKLGDDVTHATLNTTAGDEREVLLAHSGERLLLITDHTLKVGQPLGELQLPDGSTRPVEALRSDWLTTKHQILEIR